MRRAALTALLLIGCDGPTNSEVTPLPIPDAAYYEANVQVVVGYGCGSLDCHGDPGRPLRIYAQDGLRVRAELRGEPLSADEASRNAEAFAGVDPGAADASMHIAVLKPLAEDAGGLPHVGEDIWLSRNDPALICVRDWLAGEQTQADVCAEASAAIDPR